MKFYESNALYSNNPMLIEDNGCSLTYGEFDHFYDQVSSVFRSRTLMFLFCENTIGSVCMYLTCLRKGIVPLLIDSTLDPDLIHHLIEVYDPDYLCMPNDAAMPFSARQILTWYDYSVFERIPTVPTILHPDLALLLTTSGSTGSPKLVRQSYSNLACNACAIAEYLHLNAQERPITSLPMHYTYGLSVLNSHFQAGAAVLLTRLSLFDRAFWVFLKEKEATSLSGVPYTYSILKRLNFYEMTLPSIRTLTQAGGKISPALHQYFAEQCLLKKINFVVMYGQTEATARMSYLPPELASIKRGSIGIPIPGGRFSLENTNGSIITSCHTEGELIYQGPNVTMGYANTKNDLSKGDTWHGLLRTGDLAVRDEDGFYYITGRKKRFIKLFGKRIHLDEVECLLKDHFHNYDFACTGTDHTVYVYTTAFQQETSDTIAEWLSEKTGIHSSAIQIICISHIPKNSAGKTLYSELSDPE